MTAPTSWTPERSSAAVRMRDAGMSATMIGKRLQISRSAVLGHFHRINTPPPVRGREGVADWFPPTRIENNDLLHLTLLLEALRAQSAGGVAA